MLGTYLKQITYYKVNRNDTAEVMAITYSTIQSNTEEFYNTVWYGYSQIVKGLIQSIPTLRSKIYWAKIKG